MQLACQTDRQFKYVTRIFVCLCAYLRVDSLADPNNHHYLSLPFNRQVKMSSPKVNNIIACGIILAYLGVILLGIDKTMVDEASLLFICRVSSLFLTTISQSEN